MSTVKITSFFLFLLVVSNIYSLSTVKEEENSFNLKLHGQSAFFVDVTKKEHDVRDCLFELGRVSFELDRKFGKTEFNVLTSYTDNELHVEQLDLRYRVNKNISFRMGYLKVPFSRMSECSDSELLMYNRNPLVEFCAPVSRVGLVSEYRTTDGLVSIDLGVYNSEGIIEEYGYPILDCSGSIHFMLLGAIDKSESAVKDYDHLMIDISPGFSFVQNEYIDSDDRLIAEYNLYSGLYTAFRYSTLAVDAMFYHRLHDVNFRNFNSYKYDGFSAHVAYVFNRRIEPSIRFTTNSDVLDTYYDIPEYIYLEHKYRKNTIEYGMSFYLNDLNSKLGVYYIKSTNDIDADVTDTDFKEFEEVRLFMEIDIEKIF